MGSGDVIVVISPSDCSEQETRDFCDLATKGGQVARTGLKDLVGQAKALAFLRLNEVSIGIAGLKLPRDNYRKRQFANAKSGLDPVEFPYELGWVYVEEKFRGRQYSRKLVQQLLKSSEDQNVYATSRETEERMHRTLRKCGFTRVGTPWPSKRRPKENLLLFVRKRIAGD
jgi:predicted GNAT family N-acyltransferase